MIYFAWLPIWLAVKSYGSLAWGFVLRSRTAQIALAVVLILMLGRCAWGHYEGVKEDRDRAEARLELCQEASASQIATIKALEQAAADNSARYAALLEQSQEQADRLSQLDRERQEQTNALIEQLRRAASGDACADRDLPDGVRDNL